MPINENYVVLKGSLTDKDKGIGSLETTTEMNTIYSWSLYACGIYCGPHLGERVGIVMEGFLTTVGCGELRVVLDLWWGGCQTVCMDSLWDIGRFQGFGIDGTFNRFEIAKPITQLSSMGGKRL